MRMSKLEGKTRSEEGEAVKRRRWKSNATTIAEGLGGGRLRLTWKGEEETGRLVG